MLLNRRQLLGSAAASASALTLGLSSRSAFAQAQAPLNVKLNWIKNVQYAGLWIAFEDGYFANEGLDVSVQAGGPNTPQSVVTVAAGADDIGYSAWLPFLDAIRQGNDFVAFAATYPRAPLGIISLPGKPIVKAGDIVGSKILAQGASQKSAIEATLALAGLPNTWEMVPAGYSPEPLLAGEGEGFTGYSTNEAVALEQMGMVRGKDFFFTSFDELGYRSYGAVLFAKRSLITEQRDKIVGFTRALVRGWTKNEGDPDYAAHLAVDKYGVDYGLDTGQQRQQATAQLDLLKAGDGRRLLALDVDEIAGPMFAAANATGRVDLPDAASIVDLSIVEDAHVSL
ncbi:ABC transporter substrate-binding protein [Stappia sp. BW2]|uniref:ABC transporter substrate-binding protein n=1 Tax=Stappia sp. BW2 TaxID=2592622 RepID=UPI0011DEC9BF|nr:ABC transporter substrate-binding protein [Stappia sp. BW2]TYC64753.1 ABC transporter substrate-binding protein [Stappia sp. BW2]